MEVNNCRKWQLISEKQAPLQTPAATRLKKHYTLSLRQDVVGAYRVFTNLPAINDTEHVLSLHSFSILYIPYMVAEQLASQQQRLTESTWKSIPSSRPHGN
jgi:hypothetical protein